jgi:hypothetical protein
LPLGRPGEASNRQRRRNIDSGGASADEVVNPTTERGKKAATRVTAARMVLLARVNPVPLPAFFPKHHTCDYCNVSRPALALGLLTAWPQSAGLPGCKDISNAT